MSDLIAIVGRPNVGKSTLFNRIVGDERSVTHDMPGTTRDTIDTVVETEDGPLRFIDTAGMRRRPRIQEKLEKLSVSDTLRAIKFAEVVVLLMDSEHPFEEQDLRIADLVEREGRALVVCVSKFDLVEKKPGIIGKLREETDHWLPQVKGVPVIGVSGLTGEGIDRLMQAIVEIHAVWNKRVATRALNRWLEDVTSAHPPPAVSGRRIRLNYLTQVKARPPSFVGSRSNQARKARSKISRSSRRATSVQASAA